jgi:hypothetical protein
LALLFGGFTVRQPLIPDGQTLETFEKDKEVVDLREAVSLDERGQPIIRAQRSLCEGL